MTFRFQRLLVILVSLILITGALFLILKNSKKNLVFFYTPSELLELINTEVKINQKIRIGGLVKKNSVKRTAATSNHITFIVTDNNNNIIVEYDGILPDLFREGQGIVIEGILDKDNILDAEKVFAKHDENYIPASIKEQLESVNYWQKNY